MHGSGLTMVNHTQDAIMQGIITYGVHGILNTTVAGVLAMIIGIKLKLDHIKNPRKKFK